MAGFVETVESFSPGTWESILLLCGLTGYAAFWVHDLRRGTDVSRSSLALHIVVYAWLILWMLDVAGSELYFGGAPVLFVLLIVLVGLFPIGVYTAVRARRTAIRLIAVERAADGNWKYRGGASIVGLWLLLWFVREGIEAEFLKGYSVFFPLTNPSLTGPITGPPPGFTVLEFGFWVCVVAVLYMVAFGAMLGMSAAVWRVHGDLRREWKRAGRPPTVGGQG